MSYMSKYFCQQTVVPFPQTPFFSPSRRLYEPEAIIPVFQYSLRAVGPTGRRPIGAKPLSSYFDCRYKVTETDQENAFPIHINRFPSMESTRQFSIEGDSQGKDCGYG